VVCVDGIARRPTSRFGAVFGRVDPNAETPGVPLKEIQAVVAALAGVKLTVVDRRTGQIFTEAHMRLMETAA